MKGYLRVLLEGPPPAASMASLSSLQSRIDMLQASPPFLPPPPSSPPATATSRPTPSSPAVSSPAQFPLRISPQPNKALQRDVGDAGIQSPVCQQQSPSPVKHEFDLLSPSTSFQSSDLSFINAPANGSVDTEPKEAKGGAHQNGLNAGGAGGINKMDYELNLDVEVLEKTYTSKALMQENMLLHNDHSMETSERRVQDRLKSLHNRLKVSQIMYEEMVSENLSLMKDKERIEQELKDLRQNMRNKSDVYPTPRTAPQTDHSAQKEMNVMQQQLKVTCQEIIALRKSNNSKDSEIKKLNERIENLEHEKEEDNAAMQRSIEQLKDEKSALEKGLEEHDHVKEELLTQRHENKYLAAELEKVVLHEYEKQESEFQKEISSLKEEMNEVSESNQRMGQKIAVLITENHEKDKEIRRLQEVFTPNCTIKATNIMGGGKAPEPVTMSQFINIERSSTDLGAVYEDLELVLQRTQGSFGSKESEGDERICYHMCKLIFELKDKQIARLLRIVSKKDSELYKLRSVWYTLLNAHPDSEWIGMKCSSPISEMDGLIDTPASTSLQEVKRLKHDNELLRNKASVRSPPPAMTLDGSSLFATRTSRASPSSLRLERVPDGLQVSETGSEAQKCQFESFLCQRSIFDVIEDHSSSDKPMQPRNVSPASTSNREGDVVGEEPRVDDQRSKALQVVCSLHHCLNSALHFDLWGNRMGGENIALFKV
eukprot:759477-Hanusia_phi.AAC.1